MQPMDPIEQALVDTFIALRGTLAHLYHLLLEDGQRKAWWAADELTLTTLAARTTSVTFAPEDLTQLAPGWIGVRPETLAVAHAANTLKDQLATRVLALRPIHGANGARATATALLRGPGGEPRTSLRQAYRRLLLLDTAPARMGFTHARAHRSICHLTRSQAHTLIENIFHDERDRAYALAQLHQHPHATLYQVYPGSAHLRVNLVWHDGSRQARQAHSALIFPLHAEDPLPSHSFPGPDPNPRLPRSDLRIDPTPLIAHTPIHAGTPAA